MHKPFAALVAVSISVLFIAPAAQAVPTQVNVRIEGKAETLFEGPILTSPHRVRASSDSQWRRCDGINVNDPWNLEPRPVPTSASVDAMRIIGETFDGLWYSGYEDYFVKRWGPDGQNEGAGAFWGIVVNNVFTSVGGCQYQLDDGDEVLWTYDAFTGRPRLGLYPGGYSGGATPLTATAVLGQPYEVEVDSWSGHNEGTPPASPQRSTTPFAGAEVAPVETGAEGSERVETGSAGAQVTGSDGSATFTFTEPGWHRLKAAAVDIHGKETTIRSNRLDVCVPEPPASDCGALPAEDQVRTPPPPVAGEEEPEEGPEEPEEPSSPSVGGQAGSDGKSSRPAAEDGQVRLQLSRLDRSRIARGLVKVDWRVTDPGVGIGGWTISSLALGHRGARYVSRASGSERTAATLRLPAGATYRLRLTVVDVLGRSSSVAIGKVQVPA